MRKLLLLALLLYDIVALATRSSHFDYDDTDGTSVHNRHYVADDRRNWRKKALMNTPDDRKHWDDRRRHDYDSGKYDEQDVKSFVSDRQRDPESSFRRHYDDMERMGIVMGGKSSEIGSGHNPYVEKEPDRKQTMNCDRPYERYEPCFAGCASVTCDNPRERLQPCYPFCEPGCVCAPPRVRDDRTHKCVLPDDCTKGLKGIPDLGDET